MRVTKKQKIIVLLMVVLAAIGLWVFQYETALYRDQSKQVRTDPNSCIWVGPYVKQVPDLNIAFPDTGAAYWHAGYTLPEGASLSFQGQYPHARYMSFNSYNRVGKPASVLTDINIKPNLGSTNPFLTGADRQAENRSYAISVVEKTERQNSTKPNVLYKAPTVGEKTILIYRVYLSDEGLSLDGGVGLPEPVLTLADGRRMTGQQACDELNVETSIINNPYIPKLLYRFIRWLSDPADLPVKWETAFNLPYTLRCGFMDYCGGEPEKVVTFYANLDNHYVASFINRNYGEIVVTKGRMPVTPKTLSSNPLMADEQAQLRYWSICQNEFYSQRVTECLYDEQMVTDAEGYYTIVTAPEALRPNNANAECGVNYLPWTGFGDGYGYKAASPEDNRLADGVLVVRNMLPYPEFNQAAQNLNKPNQGPEVMGAYFPQSEYMTKAAFEDLGCSSR